MERVLLNVRRYKQHPEECAIAAAASIANYFDPTVEYSKIRNLLNRREKKDGIWTSQEARILNKLGFSDVTIVTANLDMVDFSWKDYANDALIWKLKKKATHCKKKADPAAADWVLDMAYWLSDEECDNKLVIDYDFAKHIRRSLDFGRPVGACISLTTFFRLPKTNKGYVDDIRGDKNDHAIVLRGYDASGVFVVDSDYYGGPEMKRYKNGYYKIPWDKFLPAIPNGDLILVK